MVDMSDFTAETKDTSDSLLELAANNDLEGFRQFINNKYSKVNEVGLWYAREKKSKQMILVDRTPLMVASTYGSIDVVKVIILISDTDINMACGLDKTTALHCAASSGVLNAFYIIKLLLQAGANPNLLDAHGYRPIDVIVVPPKLECLKISLEELLSTAFPFPKDSEIFPENDFIFPDELKLDDVHCISAKKEYPVNPYLPDIKNEIYSTDEFRIFSFKVRPCSRAYSHDWTECPFVHPGENARRRDPRKYHYSCVPCPEFRKGGGCRKGDMCEYAHGIFESWLHPAQYRTRLCKDGTSCSRRVCFFAHTLEELRSLFPSPRSGSTVGIDFASSMSLLSNSPSSPFSSPLSPSANTWGPQNIPALQSPGNNFLTGSRLRSSFNARDVQAHHLVTPLNLEDQFITDPAFSPSHNFHLHKNILSPINTTFSPRSFDHPFIQSPFAGPSSVPISPMNMHGPMDYQSLSSCDLGARGDFWMNRSVASGNAGQIVNDDMEGPDIGWVNSLVKESPQEIWEANRMVDGVGTSGEGSRSNQERDELDTVIGAWLEQMKFDELES